MDLRKRAEKLANRPYVEQVVKDLTTDGQSVYVAFSPELEGCMGQGQMKDEALVSLRQARVDNIQSLLEDDLFIPGPQNTPTCTTSSASITIIFQSNPTGRDSNWIITDQHSEKNSLTHLVGAAIHD
jgi:predicted RNase H-like HicB family nuclease